MEQVFRKRGLMPSGPVAESELMFDSKLSMLSEEKDTESRDSWVQLGKVGTESDGFGTQDLEANNEFRQSAFSRAVSAVLPFEVREGMEGKQKQTKLDVTRIWRRATGLRVQT